MTETTTHDVGAGAGRPPRWAALWNRLPKDLNNPLLRNAYSLMVNAGATGVLGLAYWAIAGKFYSVADYGRGFALIAAMRLLAALTSFGFVGALTRFLPEGGVRTGRLIRLAYLVGGAAAAIATGGFLLTQDPGEKAHRYGLGGFPEEAWFLLSVVLWCVFTLQDVVMTGLRKASWVPLVGIGVGVSKIVIVAALAELLPGQGIFLAWTVPAALAVIPVTILIFRNLVPRHARETGYRTPPTARRIGRFLAGDLPGQVLILTSVYLMPVLVSRLGSLEDAAYFGAAVTLAGVFDMLAINMAISLTVEGSFDTSRLADNCRTALKRTLFLLTPIVGAAVLLAPWLVTIVGKPEFAEHSAPVLRFLALATLPHAVIEIYLGVLRAQSRSRRLLVIQGLLCALVISSGTAAFLLGGLTWLGVTMFGSQLVVAAAVTPGLIGLLRRERPRDTPLEIRREMPSPDETPTLVMVIVGGYPTLVAKQPTVIIVDPTADPHATTVVTPIVRPDVLLARTAVRRSLVDHVRIWLPGLLVVEGLVLYLLALKLTPGPYTGVDLYQADALGLVSVLPPAALIGLALIVTAFFITLGRPEHRPYLLSIQLAAIAFCLHAAAPLVEPHARSAAAWGNAGVVEYILRTGESPPGGAPGVLAGVAFALRTAGVSDLGPILTWTPVVVNLLYPVPLLLLFRRMRADRRAKWLAGGIFVVAQWAGLDLFSPGAVTYLLYLGFAAILVTWFGRDDHGISGQWPSRAAGRVPLAALLIGCLAVALASSQTVPAAMFGVCVLMVAAGHHRAGWLPPILLAMLAVTWFAFPGTASPAGEVPRFMLDLRLLICATLLALAGLGQLRRMRRDVIDRSALALLLAPLFALPTADFAEVYLFALPGIALLAAYAFLPGVPDTVRTRRLRDRLTPERYPALTGLPAGERRDGRAWLALTLAFAAVAALAGSFFVARYGDERYSWFSDGEIAAVNAVHAADRGRVRVLHLGPQARGIPLGARDIERVTFAGTALPADPRDVSSLLAALRDAGPGALLISTRGQDAYLESELGYPAGWGMRIRTALARSPQVRTVLWNRDAAVFAAARQAGTPGPRAPGEPEAVPAPERGPWAPFGIALVAVLIVVFVIRQTLAPARLGHPLVTLVVAALSMAGLLMIWSGP
ncbi:hypothetical protein [Rhizohabitans arisaemae]|uniref:hypothetical protein n=1 Tax=Rhizohabitans arisaemae TaxID=2720610 RepID=UPI0024B1A501|nr:hypothetical protein [Rhizohabitans arisaemae]